VAASAEGAAAGAERGAGRASSQGKRGDMPGDGEERRGGGGRCRGAGSRERRWPGLGLEERPPALAQEVGGERGVRRTEGEVKAHGVGS
jgi:hypothetical protein